MRLVIALGLGWCLWGCPRGPPSEQMDAAALAPEGLVDAAGPVTQASLDRWLKWQGALRARAPNDGGVVLRARAALELAALASAGLTLAEVEALEPVIAAVITERKIDALTLGAAMSEFRQGLDELAPEQRAKGEAALKELEARSPRGSLAGLEAQFGAEAVRVVLTREVEVTKTWEALLAAQGEKR